MRNPSLCVFFAQFSFLCCLRLYGSCESGLTERSKHFIENLLIEKKSLRIEQILQDGRNKLAEIRVVSQWFQGP